LTTWQLTRQAALAFHSARAGCHCAAFLQKLPLRHKAKPTERLGLLSC
jgi:hypothetical protein